LKRVAIVQSSYLQWKGCCNFLLQSMVGSVKRFEPGFDAGTFERRPNSGKYLVTLNVQASARDQLNEWVRTLSLQPMVKVVL
jgi:putative lipoic acid-binding regulatory protein